MLTAFYLFILYFFTYISANIQFWWTKGALDGQKWREKDRQEWLILPFNICVTQGFAVTYIHTQDIAIANMAQF